MSRPWRAGLGARLGLILVFAALSAIGALFALRAQAIQRAAERVWALRAEESALREENQKLHTELEDMGKPAVVERLAREILRWGYPDEELVILIRRR